MGLVVARAERRLVSNLSTGVQFLGRECNSHYHLRLSCLKNANPGFVGDDIAIPDDVKTRLNNYQKMYLMSCISCYRLECLIT